MVLISMISRRARALARPLTCTIHVVVDSVENGIAIGGMRIIPEASVQETAELARAMIQKLKLFGVPVGGAKALVAPRRGYSFADMREDIAEIMQPFLESGFLLGEDVGTTY